MTGKVSTPGSLQKKFLGDFQEAPGDWMTVMAAQALFKSIPN